MVAVAGGVWFGGVAVAGFGFVVARVHFLVGGVVGFGG